MFFSLFLFWFFCACVWLYQRLTFFKRHKVPSSVPVPILGDLAAVTLSYENIDATIQRGYNKFKNKRFFGLYQYMVPTIIPRDPELIRNCLLKDYSAFCDRGFYIPPEGDDFFSRNLFMLRGKRWRDMRSTLSPAFSTGRMRTMAPLMAQTMITVKLFLQKHVPQEGSEINTDEMTRRYTDDVIATCAFGWLVQPDTVFTLGKTAVIDSTPHLIKFFGFESFPRIMRFLGVKLIGNNHAEEFKAVFKAALNARRNGIAPYRPDFIQTLVDSAKGKLKPEDSVAEDNFKLPPNWTKEFSDDDLVSNATLFYVAGYDSTANLINYLLYALARQPDIQKRVRDEVKDVNLDGSDIYDVLNGLEYLDMCVAETLRLWPLVGSVTRRCTQTYDFGPISEDEKEHFICPPGVHLWTPIYSIHRDEKYWPEPNKFDPERFHPSRRSQIKPCTYMPFGLGPKQCIAPRFSEIACKVLMVYLVQRYNLSPSKSTPTEDQIAPDAFVLRPKGGFNLQLTPLYEQL